MGQSLYLKKIKKKFDTGTYTLKKYIHSLSKLRKIYNEYLNDSSEIVKPEY